MMHIDYGLGAISADVLGSGHKAGPFDLADISHRLVAVGRPRRYEGAKRLLQQEHPPGMPLTAAAKFDIDLEHICTGQFHR
jgi:hypothetical protein